MTMSTEPPVQPARPDPVPFDFSRLKARWAAERAAGREESERLAALVRRVCMPILKARGATAVYLFGSVAEHRAGPNSDIDLLALGVRAEDYWALRRDLEQALGRPLDLITQDDDRLFVTKIIDRGQCLYDAQS
jgi:predicted nucleotidyltransferase